MPRRPRPNTRTPPTNAKGDDTRTKAHKPARASDAHSKATTSRVAVPSSKKRPALIDEDEDVSEEDRLNSQDETEDGEDDMSDEDGLMPEEEEDDDDIDADRVVQWVDDDEETMGRDVEGESDEEEEYSDEETAPAQGRKEDITPLLQDISDIPFGTLRKAQRSLAQAVEDESDSGSEDASSDSEADDSGPETTTPERVEWSAHPKKDIAKRSSKHAPTEVTSKKPVTRRRQVVEAPNIQPRDPRFLPLTGELAPQKFKQSYAFLADMHRTELATLRDNLSRARKLLANSPRHLHDERTREVDTLERALKKAESAVHRDKRDEVEQRALERAAKEERERRAQGKGSWYMKEKERRELLTRARHDALAAEGGKSAVSKAIDKKRKKIAQKEKKARPYAKGTNADRPVKRRKVA